MLLVCVISYFVVGLLGIAVLARLARRSGSRRAERAAASRRRLVEEHLTQISDDDIRAALVRHGVAVDQARLVTTKAAEHGIEPLTMWVWLQRHGAASLGIVVLADVSHLELLTHLSYGTVPHLEELALFASANGLDVAGSQPRTPAGRKVLVDSTVRPDAHRRPRLG